MLHLNFIKGLVFSLLLCAATALASDDVADLIISSAPQSEEIVSVPLDWLKPWQGDFDAMVERGFIRVLTTYNKSFYFIDRRGNQRGITYDTFMEFERQLNAKLLKEKMLPHRHLKIRIVFIPVARDELIPSLLAGRGDIAAANLTVTANRLQQVQFSKPLATDVQEVVLSAPGLAAITNKNELSDKVVFVRRSSSYYESLIELNNELIADNKLPIKISYAPEVLEDDDLIEMLHANLISYIVVDKYKAEFWKKIFPQITINNNAVLRDDGKIAWAIRKDSPQLLSRLNAYTEKNAKGSKIANVILQKYLEDIKYVTDAVSEKDRARFVKISEYFRKYGAQYDIDWLLMTAQGYQESQLNQAARSKVGAIGVMQLMPATGKQMNVGDIRKLGPNIHAGIKYVRWIIDNFYQDEKMTPLDKVLFAFASYNAGPARVTRLRKSAEERGYNPNIWFANVEYIAAEKIGSETVTYVSNIYKYFIAYTLLAEHMEDKSVIKEMIEQ